MKKSKQTEEPQIFEEDALEESPPQDVEFEVLDNLPPPLNPDAKEMLDKYQRCLAEFDNYRKRTAKEMASRYDDGIRATCEKLLPIVDNFERALAAADNKEDSFFKGIEMIARQFDNMLEGLGVKSIEIEPGGEFDTNLHHAVAHTEDENFGENEIVEVLQKGYIHRDRVIRHAMVKVAN
jgi:molecular chaperone GrpE